MIDLETIKQLRPGQTVRVHQTIKEGAKERIQVFEGLITGRQHGDTKSGTMTVRKVSDGIAVERIFPVHSPIIAKLEILRQAKVRRAKLTFLKKPKSRPLRERIAKK